MHSVLVVVVLVAQSCLTLCDPWPELILPDGEILHWARVQGFPRAQSPAASSPSGARRAGPVSIDTAAGGCQSVTFPRPASLEGDLRGASPGPCSLLSPSSQASAMRGICCFYSWRPFPHLQVTVPRFRGWRMGKEPQPCPSLFGSGETDCQVKLTSPTCLLL